MNKKLLQVMRFTFVTVGIIMLTSFTIDATDTLRGSQTALSIFAKNMNQSKCDAGMVAVNHTDGSFCIDTYEVSPSEDCIVALPASTVDTAHNIAHPKCVPVSVPSKTPWTFVARPQAVELCAKAGKRLPTAAEWFLAVLGTSDAQTCNLRGGLATSGSYEQCVSGSGAFDMVGNVWEYTSETVTDATFQGRPLPSEGYVALADPSGVALETALEPNAIYNSDYFWAAPLGYYTVIRGGFYGSGADGGVYATHAQTDQNFASAAIGFRCVK